MLLRFLGGANLSAARWHCHPGKTLPLFADHHWLEAPSSLDHNNRRRGRWQQSTSVRLSACGQSGEWRPAASAVPAWEQANLTTRLGSGPSFNGLPRYKVTERIVAKSLFLNRH